MVWATPVDNRLGYKDIPSRTASIIWRKVKRGWTTSRTDDPPSPLARLVLECLRNRCGRTW